MKKIVRLNERDLTRIIKRVMNENISDMSGELYSRINNVIDNFEGIDQSEIVSVLENILSHHKAMEYRHKRNIGPVTSREVRKNFSR